MCMYALTHTHTMHSAQLASLLVCGTIVQGHVNTWTSIIYIHVLSILYRELYCTDVILYLISAIMCNCYTMLYM